jgi:hypothetical protein
VTIRPGVALDPAGRVILVPQPLRYRLSTAGPDRVYLLLLFRDIPTEPLPSIDSGGPQHSRMLEGFAVGEYDRLPDTPYVELARVSLGEGKNPLVAAADAALPGLDEIDLRFRRQPAIRPPPLVTVGLWHAPDPDAPPNGGHAAHAAGLACLARELAGPHWQLHRRDERAGETEALGGDVLLLPLDKDLALTDADRARLRVFLDEGGVILAEPCSLDKIKGNGPLDKLAKALEREPRPVEPGHPLLTAAHVFAVPPPGAAATGRVFEDRGLVLSTSDYACAWKGGLADDPPARETIRAAQEFGANLLAYAQQRRAAWRASL